MLSAASLALTLVLLPVQDDDVSKDVDVHIMRLSGENSVFRERAARKLGDLGPRARLAIPHLETALGDDDKAVRLAAAYGLARMKKDGKRVAAAVAKRLKKEKEPEVRANLCWALEAFGDLKTARAPLQKALGDKDATVAANAARALGGLGAVDRGSVSALSKATRNSDWSVRVNACWAL
ncbi:MAG: HEAT repeat domain-containing protein, partial [Planctomycetota bacterium]